MNATIGSKTSSMRSFWSDLEKSDQSVPPSPSKSPSSSNVRSPPVNKSPSFQNNIFIQSDKGSSNSNSPSPTKSPDTSPSESRLATSDIPKSTVTERIMADELNRKSSLSRSGSGSRLHGPRELSNKTSGAELSPSPSKLKKMVTFDNSAQVIQYESITPEMSSSPSIESRASEDDEFEDVPVIEPTPYNRGNVPTGRPLPQIPPHDQEGAEKEEEQEQEAGPYIKSEPHDDYPARIEDEEEEYAQGGRSISPSLVRKDSLDNDMTDLISQKSSEQQHQQHEEGLTHNNNDAEDGYDTPTGEEQQQKSPKDDRSITPTEEPEVEAEPQHYIKPEPQSDNEEQQEGGNGQSQFSEFQRYSTFMENTEWANNNDSSEDDEQDERQFEDAPETQPSGEQEEEEEYDVDYSRPSSPQIKHEPESFISYHPQLQPDFFTNHYTSSPQIKQEPVDYEYDNTDESPVPSLDKPGNSPNSFDSPTKTEKTSPEQGHEEQQEDSERWPTVYSNEGDNYEEEEQQQRGREIEFNLPSMQNEFDNDFSNMFSKSREISGSYEDNNDKENTPEPNSQEEPEPEQELEDAQQPELDVNEPRTIRASSGRLKMRPSLTPMDKIGRSRSVSSNKSKDSAPTQGDSNDEPSKPVPMLQLSYDSISEETNSMFGNLDEEFDKMLTVQKRGYTLRENDSVVVAKERRRVSSANSTSSTNNNNQSGGRKISGPVKIVEPTKSSRKGSLNNKPSMETTPEHSEPELPNTDKGRLFIRVVSIKEIDLPSIDDRGAKFDLTLDNGIHCITTPLKQLKRSSFLDQEFELTVGDELEFILSLKAKYTKQHEYTTTNKPSIPPPSTTNKSESPSKNRMGFSRIFGSPKKRIGSTSSNSSNKLLQQSPVIKEQQPQQETTIVKRDPWESIIATDGSFGRSYVSFSQYKGEIYGKPATFDIPCFNEWAKNGKAKKAPYKIGKLQVQMMFVPRGSQKETLPRSIKESLEILRESRKQEPIYKEGYLSQLGGDCKYWRRRYFILDGGTLTAYSETSRKPRATINLAKALRVIHEKNQLTQPVVMVGKNRRKSAFAQEEEAFMFVNEAFRIRFANGEIIDFYADGEQIKDDWIESLGKVIGSTSQSQPWVDLVKKYENKRE